MKTVKHYKNNKLYQVVEEKAKMKVDDVWYDCVIYKGLECGGVYVREEKDFNLKFK